MSSGVYYSILDTVNFNPLRPRVELEQLRVSAAGTLMLGILIGNTNAVLTDAQVFDNRLIIDIVSQFDRESEAFLHLVREGRLQARLLQAPSLEAQSSKRVTFVDTFVAALNRPNFVFSAWPGLEDPSIRQAIAAAIAGGADPSKEFDDPELIQRITAIRELSDSFELASKGSSLGLAPRPVFGHRLIRVMENLRLNPETQEAADWILRAAAEQADNLEYRSTWYRIVESVPGSALDGTSRATLLDGVSSVYNEAVSRRLNCDPDISFSDLKVVDAATGAGLTGQWGLRVVKLAQDPAVQDVMTWSLVRQILPHLESFTDPQARLSYLINEFSECFGRERLEKSTATWLRVRAPQQIVAKMAAIGTAEAGLVVSTALGGSHLAQAVGALVGVVTVLGGIPTIRRIMAAREQNMVTREITNVRMTLTRNSSAWVQHLGND
jgi:hypothetical protein